MRKRTRIKVEALMITKKTRHITKMRNKRMMTMTTRTMPIKMFGMPAKTQVTTEPKGRFLGLPSGDGRIIQRVILRVRSR